MCDWQDNTWSDLGFNRLLMMLVRIFNFVRFTIEARNLASNILTLVTVLSPLII